jgi:hypothetical protein
MKTKTTFTVKTKSGKEYNVRLMPIKIGDMYKELGVNGGWDKDAEIEINGEWHRCKASQARQNGEMIQTVCISKYNKDIHEAMNLSELMRKNDVHIIATEGWQPLYEDMLKGSNDQFIVEANKAVFSEITFTYHSNYKYMSFRWDSELDSDYIGYNDQISELKKALKYIKPDMLSAYKTASDYDDYNCLDNFKVPTSDIELIKSFSLPGLEKAKEEKEKAEEYARKVAAKKANIENGAIYFTCESAPHDEDLSKVILNRPAQNKGAFTLDHRISEGVFAQIKKYGRYYDADFLEECDMFFLNPGWRFSIDAIRELSKTNDVYINDAYIDKVYIDKVYIYESR